MPRVMANDPQSPTTEVAPQASQPTESKTEPCPPPEANDKASPKYRILDTWVQGGTTTWEHDKERQRQRAEAEKRRNQHDAEHAMASRPIERGGAKMHSAEMTAPTDPKVLLRYKDMEILCELTRDDHTGKRMLLICCPECVLRGESMDAAQFTVREDNRKWDIDTRTAGQMKTCVDVDFYSGMRYQQVYMSAGVVMDSEAFRCPHPLCSVRYKIDNNVLIRVR